ncbi:MAG: hypothetical protein CMH89_01690 [Oceanicaulis sp.]|mgnify:FL=1|nr:hypothetical protein [Oceanicaulis sp.]
MKRRTVKSGTPRKRLSESQNLRREDIDALSDDEAVALWMKFRFAETDGRPVCPNCGTEKPYFITTRNQFRCRNSGCRKTFSLTSDTYFHSPKKSLRDILKAMVEFSLKAQHMTVDELSKALNLSTKTAAVWMQKLTRLCEHRMFAGVFDSPVAYDTAEFHGRLRNPNLRARGSAAKGRNLGKRLHYLAIKENRHYGRMVMKPFEDLKAAEIGKYIMSKIARGSMTFMDEASGWKRMYGYHKQKPIKHKTSYWKKGKDGEPDRHTNHAESVFSGLRVKERVARGWAPQNAQFRCAEECYRRESAALDDIDAFFDLGKALAKPGQNGMRGYWKWYKKRNSPSGCARGVHTRSCEEWKRHFRPKLKKSLASML